jgi:hypothetical protein
VLVDTAKTWARVFGPAKGSVIREALVARLILERRLGQLLDGVVVQGGHNKKSKLIADESALPEWITWNVSSAAQTLAKAPKRWFDKVIQAIKDEKRRPNMREVYLEARRMVPCCRA